MSASYSYTDVFQQAATPQTTLSADEGILAIGYLTMTCDRQISQEEERDLNFFLMAQGYTESECDQAAEKVGLMFEAEGAAALFQAALQAFPDEKAKLQAYELATRVVLSDLKIEHAEDQFLAELGPALGLSGNQQKEVLKSVAAEPHSFAFVLNCPAQSNDVVTVEEAVYMLISLSMMVGMVYSEDTEIKTEDETAQLFIDALNITPERYTELRDKVQHILIREGGRPGIIFNAIQRSIEPASADQVCAAAISALQKMQLYNEIESKFLTAATQKLTQKG